MSGQPLELPTGAVDLRGSGARPSLAALMPNAAARLRWIDTIRWGRFRRDATVPSPGPVRASEGAERWLQHLEALGAQDADGHQLAAVLLAGASVGVGSADLRDDELRLSTHHLPLIEGRWRAARGWSRERLASRPGALALRPMPDAVSEAVEELSEVASLCWTHYRTYLWLRDTGALLSGTPEQEAFDSLKRGPHTAAQEDKVFLWFTLADHVFMGVQQHLLSLGVERIHRLARRGCFADLVEIAVLGMLFGEGRCVSFVRGALRALYGPLLSRGLLELSTQLSAALEPRFREVCDPVDLDLRWFAEQLVALTEAAPAPRPAFGDELELAIRGEQEREVRLAERWIEQSVARRSALGPVAGDGWAPLRTALQAAVSAVAEDGPRRMDIERIALELQGAIDHAAVAARNLPEVPFWPGDGEEYRVRRQRSAAAVDRLFHMLGLAERVALSLDLWLADQPTNPHHRPSSARFIEIVEHRESAQLVEEWVSRYGPRLDTIFGGAPWSVRMECNQQLRDLDLRVRDLVLEARRRGGTDEVWGPLHAGLTDRLRELLRRHGCGSILDRGVEQLILADDLVEAARLIRSTGLVGAQPSDLDVPVTVAVHVFNAHPPTVRQNMLRNQQIDWRLDRRFLVLGTSSSNRGIVEQERAMCVETGATHWFLSARRHKKAGNQNRIIPNAATDPQGRGYYFTLDDDYVAGTQVLQRIVPMAERHPRIAFLQLPMYLYGSEWLGISRARFADAAGMGVWGSITSPGMRDVRLLSRDFAHRRPLALPFGTSTLLRLDPTVSALVDTNGFHTGTVTEDFAQGQTAFGLAYLSHPKPPENRWDDGLLLDEIWVEGDGVELFGRVAQQTRWCEGSIRNALTIWSPILGVMARRALGLRKVEGDRRPGLLQVFTGTLLAFGYVLELASMLLFLVAFPLTVFQAEPSGSLVHSLLFWGSLWAVHMLFHGWLGIASGMSIVTYLDQHFIRFASITGVAEGIYRAVRDPSKVWAANKDPKARLPVRTHLVFLAVAVVNVVAAVVGWARELDVYLLCLVGAATALWQYRFLGTVPMEVVPRILNLPRRNPVATLAQAFMRWEGWKRPIDDTPVAAVPLVVPSIAVVASLTATALAMRYATLLPDLGGLMHRQPVFLVWLVASDLCQVLALGWLWIFAAAGMLSRDTFHWRALIAAGEAGVVQARDNARGLLPDAVRRQLGRFVAWFLGRRPLHPALGFLGASGLPVLLAGLAFALRWVHVDRNGVFMDESFYIIAGRRIFAQGMARELLEVMFGSYLYPMMTAAAHGLLGVTGSRLLSMISGAITAVAVAQVGDRIGGRTVGLLAGLVVAVTHQHIYISSLGLYDAPAVAGLAVSMALVATALRGEGHARMREQTRASLLLMAGVAGAVGVLIKYVAVVMLPALALAVWVWSPTVSRQVRLQRSLAFVAPVGLGLLVYGLRHWSVLLGWWAFTQRYTTLVENDVERLVDIYMVQSLNIGVGFLLAAVGVWGRRALPSRPARADVAVLGLGAASFMLFHVATRADVNFSKHITFAFPFLVPLVAMGLRVLGLGAERLYAARGLPLALAQRLGRATMVLSLVLLGLYQVDRVAGSLQWWPDVRDQARVASLGVVAGDRVLVDDTGAELYLMERGALVDTPFWTAHANLQGPAAARQAVWDRAYSVVVLTGGVTVEGRAMHAAVGPVMAVAGYRRIYGSAGADPTVGVWLRN